jgi:four helix bundle protein
MNEKGNVIVEKSFSFSLGILEYCSDLDQRRMYAISRQLVRSGTSIGANIAEAQSAESRRDFIHKLKIADKELHETEYWLRLCQAYSKAPDCTDLLDSILEIKKIINRILITSKSTLQSSRSSNDPIL